MASNSILGGYSVRLSMGLGVHARKESKVIRLAKSENDSRSAGNSPSTTTCQNEYGFTALRKAPPLLVRT